ncbi:hypothetical protein Q428_08475 [Fervidicella metallireducens AeB]|uniref:Uncharacterized protein n=2 Tax=Fervidicella TaxID=1403538 RepID=A0A017RU84_9CLOT|nr:hypothetical protein Q428_08475 [Fervidicella metallireducens AeB]
MLIFLFAVLWGGITALIMCAPYGYYPLFISLLIISIAAYFISNKFFKKPSRYMCLLSIAIFLLFYSLCSYIIFKPSNYYFHDVTNLTKNKKAIIFYCEGEMEKYTPYYANHYYENVPVIFKPFYMLKLKRIYSSIGINTKNKDLLAVAADTKNSLLNYKPYYFYIAFKGYSPDIKDSVNSAITDGCSEIVFVNYTHNQEIKDIISKEIPIEILSSKGINFKFSESVYLNDKFANTFVTKIINMPFKWDGILLLDNETRTSNLIKNELINLGYSTSQIVITTDIDNAMKSFRELNAKNILYVNLLESGNGIKSEITIPESFEKYSSEFKITGIKHWGYDKNYVKAVIDVILKTEE